MIANLLTEHLIAAYLQTSLAESGLAQQGPEQRYRALIPGNGPQGIDGENFEDS